MLSAIGKTADRQLVQSYRHTCCLPYADLSFRLIDFETSTRIGLVVQRGTDYFEVRRSPSDIGWRTDDSGHRRTDIGHTCIVQCKVCTVDDFCLFTGNRDEK